jgi:hypothetical protein
VRVAIGAVVTGAFMFLSALPAHSAGMADFYKNHTVSVMIGYSTGNA